MRALLLVAAFLATPAWADDCGPLPPVFDGLAFAGDGDTIYGVSYPAIRLWGLQAPELRDRSKRERVPGMRARAHVADLLAASSHRVRCEPIEWDKHCRVVATCTTAAGIDLTFSTLQAGYAYGYYLAAHPERRALALTYAAAEATARKERHGLWPQWLGERSTRP